MKRLISIFPDHTYLPIKKVYARLFFILNLNFNSLHFEFGYKNFKNLANKPNLCYKLIDKFWKVDISPFIYDFFLHGKRKPLKSSREANDAFSLIVQAYWEWIFPMNPNVCLLVGLDGYLVVCSLFSIKAGKLHFQRPYRRTFHSRPPNNQKKISYAALQWHMLH